MLRMGGLLSLQVSVSLSLDHECVCAIHGRVDQVVCEPWVVSVSGGYLTHHPDLLLGLSLSPCMW